MRKQFENTTAGKFVKNIIGQTNGLQIISKTKSGREVIICSSEHGNMNVLDRWNGGYECTLAISNKSLEKLEIAERNAK